MPAVLGGPLRRLRSAVLTAGALLGALCLLATLVLPMAGVRPLIFLSGSMSPAIPAGSLALARTTAAADIEVNDIVTVPSNGSFVTHRVVEVTHAPGKATLLLRGDGNTAVDPTAYEVAQAPRTVFWVPGLGAVVAWFTRAPGVYVLAAWVALVVGSVRRHRDPAGAPRPPAPKVGRPALVLRARRLLAQLEGARPVDRPLPTMGR